MPPRPPPLPLPLSLSFFLSFFFFAEATATHQATTQTSTNRMTANRDHGAIYLRVGTPRNGSLVAATRVAKIVAAEAEER